jgi:toxin FitB
VAEVWGESLAVTEKHIDEAGLAATARSHRLVLVTRNTKDFIGRGVPLLNPYKSPPERLV